MSDQDLENRIRLRAHALWEEEGRPDGRADEHWRLASSEIIGGEIPEGGEEQSSPNEDGTPSLRQEDRELLDGAGGAKGVP
jgi:hypothetical protein